MHNIHSIFLLALAPLAAAFLRGLNHAYPGCRCIPGDECWPSEKDWSRLNHTINGRLIATQQLAQVCHGSTYNETACNLLRDNWDHPETHMFTAGEFNAPYWQNQSCDPFTPQSRPCILGNYVSYSINVTSAEDVIAGFEFARRKNIRVAIKNTGHDYMAKSTGKGALAFWTFNLKGSKYYSNYWGANYSGPALRIGAGMMAGEAYLDAKKLGYRLVGGDCPTVGLAGGYTQGGGHSPIQSLYGMGADNVLEWEVVTPQGQHVVARPDGPYADLYWALSGGGGGTWGVVLSMTSRLHPDGPVGGASFAINEPSLSADDLWAAIDVFHAELPAIVDTGTTITYQLTNTSFSFYTATAPNLTEDEVRALLGPFLAYLDNVGIGYNLTTTYYPTYYDHMDHYFGPYPYGHFPISQLTSGRLVHRETIASSNESRTALTNTFRSITANGDFYLALVTFDHGVKLRENNSSWHPDNSVPPFWRESIIYAIIISPWDWNIHWDDMLARQDELTTSIMPAVESVTPGSGSYLNEANFEEPDWQNKFYGVNWPRLSAIKRHIDPDELLYARTAVGSDTWAEDVDGRLCRL